MPSQLTIKSTSLIWIRWVSFFTILVTLWGSTFFNNNSSLTPSSYLLLGFSFLSNILFQVSYPKIRREGLNSSIFILTLSDIFILSSIIMQNGGAHNPFSSLFLVFAGLSALLLSFYYFLSCVLIILTLLGFIYSAIPNIFNPESMTHFNQHLLGMWLANTLGVLLVSFWIYIMKRQNEIIALKNEATQKILANLEKTESLGRIVAQASHQLNTPLGTIQLGLSELADPILNADEKKRWLQDMQHAIDSMTHIISQIHQKRVESDNDQPLIHLERFINNWVDHWANPRKIKVQLDINISDVNFSSNYAEKLGNILTILLDNAFEATNKTGFIKLNVRESEKFILLTVIDNGTGMTQDIIQQAFEPLFTTKADGTGLGLYLAKQLALQMNGHININSQPGMGTQIEIQIKK